MGVALALLVCLVLGGLLDRALFGVPGAGVIERFGRALLFGFGGAGCVSMLLDAAGAPVGVATLLPVLGVLAILLALRVRRVRPVPGAPRATAGPAPSSPAGTRVRPSRWERLACAALLLVAAASLLQPLVSAAVRPAFQFDALTRWLFKAKVLALEETLRGDLSTDPAFAFTHQRYPPLLPHVSRLPALLTGTWDERDAASMGAWFAVGLVAIVHGALRRRTGALKAALGATWIASLPLIAYLPGPPAGAGAFSALADVPLAFFATGAGLALLDALDGMRDHAHLEAGLLLGFCALTKNEGLPLLAGAALALLAGATTGRWRRAIGVAGLGVGVYVLAWGWLSQRFPALDENYPARLNATALGDGLSRLPGVLASFGRELVSVQRWNVTWPALLALVAIGRLTRPLGALLVLLVVQLLVYVLAYLVTGWTSPAAVASSGDPVPFLLGLTLGRLLLHVAPLFIVLGLLAAPDLSRRPA